jgi:hypothetical protein
VAALNGIVVFARDAMRLSSHRPAFQLAVTCAIVVWAALVASRDGVVAGQREGAAPSGVMPRYDANNNLLLPDGYRQWVLVGTALGLSYADGGRGSQMFHATLMEPGAYRHFTETGTFREGTMLALVLQGIGANTMPARAGQFASDVHAVEMAVKDASRVPEGWAYYDFGGSMSGGFRAAAAPQPKSRCFECHAEHAARDNVFMQFYGLLKEAGTPVR